MYNIAVINHEGFSQSDYVKKLEGKQNQIHLLSMDEIVEQVEKVDAVIIGHRDSADGMSQTCAAIIKIRERTKKFIWVLTEQSTKINRMVYLQLGCDGIFDEHIDSEEFSLIVTTILNRRVGNKQSVGSEKQFGVYTSFGQVEGLRLNAKNFSANIAGKGDVSLTKLEFKALELLNKRLGEAVSYEELHQDVWGDDSGNKRYRIANLIFHLRNKLEENTNRPVYIKTVRSRGYMLSN